MKESFILVDEIQIVEATDGVPLEQATEEDSQMAEADSGKWCKRDQVYCYNKLCQRAGCEDEDSR